MENPTKNELKQLQAAYPNICPKAFLDGCQKYDPYEPEAKCVTCGGKNCGAN